MVLIINFCKYNIYFLLLIIKLCNNSEIYKIPFGLKKINEGTKTTNIVQNIYLNIIYVNLTIGTPPKSIPFELNINSQSFFISRKYFNLSKSLSLLTKEEISYKNEDVLTGYNAKDILKIGNKEAEINFIFETKIKKENNLSNIGLLIPKRVQDNVYPFFTSLKRAGLINSYTWTLKYFTNISILDTIFNYERENKSIGEFIIGDEPHNYEKNKNIYNEKQYKKINPLWYEDDMYWDLYFDTIYIEMKNNNNEDNKLRMEGNSFAEINLDIGFIVGPNEYFRTILNVYFNKFKNICKEKFLSESLFRYIECDNNETFNLSSFPDIYFEHKELETVFNFTYKDLFILDENRNKYIFLVFNNRFTNHWILGGLFLRKYQFTFNVDSKTMGYYKSSYYYNKDNYDEEKNNINNINIKEKDEVNQSIENIKMENVREGIIIDNKNNNNNNESNKNQIIIFILLFLILFVLLIILGLLIHKKFTSNKRKKRINELEEENKYYNSMEKEDD